MKDFKKLLTDNVIEPAANGRSSSTIIGEVIESNETLNTCKVKFTNSKGNIDTRSNILVFSYNKSVIDWFPIKHDKVILQENGNNVYITGPAETSSSSRSKNKLENDIFTETYISTMGGYVY